MPITAVRCDLVILDDMKIHPTVKILLDALQSALMRREIGAIPGYESSVTGNTIAER